MIDWNESYRHGTDFRPITMPEINRIMGYMPQGIPVINSLDIGCGTGQLTRELWHRGLHPTGIDTSEAAIALAQAYTTLGPDEITYMVHDLERDCGDFRPGSFSLITCKLVYAFIRDRQSFLRNVATVLAADGIFVIITPLHEDVPETRRHIAVDYDQTLVEVESFFDVLSSERDAGWSTFICRRKTTTM